MFLSQSDVIDVEFLQESEREKRRLPGGDTLDFKALQIPSSDGDSDSMQWRI